MDEYGNRFKVKAEVSGGGLGGLGGERGRLGGFVLVVLGWIFFLFFFICVLSLPHAISFFLSLPLALAFSFIHFFPFLSFSFISFRLSFPSFFFLCSFSFFFLFPLSFLLSL